MKNKIKDLRVRIDGLAQLTKELKPYSNEVCNPPTFEIEEFKSNSKEIEKATDSLYLAKAWLGTILGELGEDTPYANDGKRKTVEDIEEAADKPGVGGTAFTVYFGLKDMFHIEKVDWLREEIKNIIHNTEDFSENIDYIELEKGFVYKYLCEARFWLGAELGRIRDEKN